MTNDEREIVAIAIDEMSGAYVRSRRRGARWSRPAAIHEAGHAVAFLVMGIPIERVDVWKKHGEKFTVGSIGGRTRRAERVSTIRQEVTGLYAGPVAEARHKRCALSVCLIESIGAGGDWSEIESLLSPLSDPAREQAHKECKAAAQVIIRERWAEVLRLAETLVRCGHVVQPRLTGG
jgi:hypothetical protein